MASALYAQYEVSKWTTPENTIHWKKRSCACLPAFFFSPTSFPLNTISFHFACTFFLLVIYSRFLNFLSPSELMLSNRRRYNISYDTNGNDIQTGTIFPFVLSNSKWINAASYAPYIHLELDTCLLAYAASQF